MKACPAGGLASDKVVAHIVNAQDVAAGRPPPAGTERSGLQAVRPRARVPHPQRSGAPLRCRPSIVVAQRCSALTQPGLLQCCVLAQSGLQVPRRCSALPEPGLVCRRVGVAGSCCLLEHVGLSLCTGAMLACKMRQSAIKNILQGFWGGGSRGGVKCSLRMLAGKQRAGDVDLDMLAGNSWAMQQSHDGAGSCQ